MTFRIGKTLSLFFALIITAHAYAQTTTISGRVQDAATREAMSWVTVSVRQTGAGTVTDSAGYFTIGVTPQHPEIEVSMIGYERQVYSVKAGTTNIDIQLKPTSTVLKELVVKPTKKHKRIIDTAALYVLAQVIAHKSDNDPAGIPHYSLNEHTKLVLALEHLPQKFMSNGIARPFGFFFQRPDTAAEGQTSYPLLIEEEYNQTYHQAQPKVDRKVVSYRKISGLKGHYLANLAMEQFKIINLYEEVYNIVNVPFTSPFAKSARAVYSYHLLDTVRDEHGTTYRLNFVAKNKADVALKGEALIDSATWGIREIHFRPNEHANINYITDYSIGQQYTPVAGRWVLSTETLAIDANVLESSKMLSAHITKVMTRDSISTTVAIPDAVSRAKDDLLINAFAKPKAYIDSVRITSLTDGEEHVYWALDTAKSIPAYKRLTWAANLLTTGNLKAGPIELGRIDQLVSRNATEGWRFKLGIRTNDMMSKKIYLYSHVAYGTDIKKWSFDQQMTIRLSARYDRWQSITMGAKNDMVQLGREDGLIPFDNILTLLSPKRLSRVINVSSYSIAYERDIFKDLSAKVRWANTSYYSVPGKYTFQRTDDAALVNGNGQIATTELGLDLRYSKNSQYIEKYGQRRFLKSKYPTIAFHYTMGIKGVLNSEYSYHKLEARLDQMLQMPIVGYADISVRSGVMFGQIPYPVAYTAPGNTSFIKDDKSFELVRPFEFQYDKYITFSYEHHFQGLLFNHIPYVSKAKLREFLSVKMAYGSYSAANRSLVRLLPETHTSTTLPYIELGCGIENILKIFQVSFSWRATYRDEPGAQKFAVKLGIRPGF